MRKLKLILLMLMALMLAPLAAFGSEVPDASPAPTVRVYLKRQALTDRADLLLTTDYTVRLASGTTLFLPKGAEPTVVLRGGRLILFYDGLSVDGGTALLFLRNGSFDDGTGGFRLSSTGNLFPGDLKLTIRDGQLYPVLTISVEDYLKGVVPYEMSDSYPLEALKVQAVCARTYAMARIDPGREYDLVDTTDDQVFFGVNFGNANAIRAVTETAGVVGVYDGKLAVCYYAASNGGQTDTPKNVWGSALNYYAVADDPYDLENPESVVLRCRLARNDPKVPETFRAILAGQLAGALGQRGYDTAPDSFRVDSISAIGLDTPRFAPPNRLYTRLHMTFAFSGRRVMQASWTDTDGTVHPAELGAFEALGDATVDLELFPDTIQALGLSVYGANNELVTLQETETDFILTSRRFGHGVGMSQRGAQTMAGTYGMNYVQILNFYYPGMQLGRMAFGVQKLATADPALAATPGPSATPTPRPTLMPVTADGMPEGSWIASVEGIDDDSSLNLRAAPNGAAEILRRLYKHQRLIVLEACEEEGWVHVRTDTMEGYVMERFLEKVDENGTAAMPPV